MSAEYLPETLEWEAYEHLHIDRTPDWFWGIGLTALVLVILALLMKNITFAILIIVSAFVLTLRALKVPTLQSFALTRKGIIEDNVLHAYTEISSFWVSDENDHPKLLIKPRRELLPLIIIPLGDMSPEIIHNYLIQFIDSERIEESKSQKVLEYFGFN